MKQKCEIPFWESSFREEVESKVVENGILLWSFSGPSFGLRTPQAMLYLDPFFGGDPVECAPNTYRTTAAPLDPGQIQLCDAVLISHEHYDHCHEETLLAMAKGTACLFYGPASAVKEMLSFGMPEERIREVKIGERIQIKDVTFTAWPGYDENAPQAVVYVIASGGVKALFGGDSAAGPSFDEIGASGDLDIAMLAFGRTWYMNESQTLDAAGRLHPKLLLPYHWELWRAHTGDALELGRLIERRKLPFEVQLLLVGDYLHYQSNGKFTKGK